MVGTGHCAVYGCSNDRRYPAKFVIKDHISAFDGGLKLRFWSCPEKHFSTWSKLINREVIDKKTMKTSMFKVGKYTSVCSNHFEYGRPTDVSPHPTKYMKGYDTPPSQPKRSAPRDRSSTSCSSRPSKKLKKDQCSISSTTSSTSLLNESYDIDFQFEETSLSSVPQPISSPKLESLTKPPKEVRINRLSWKAIQSYQRVIKLYTGCPSAKVFMFIVNRVRRKHDKVSYYKGNSSFTVKKYQHSPSKPLSQKKPGPSRQLDLEDEILMTLMRIRLDSPVEDLAFRFKVSPSHASRILTTHIVLLARELSPLIYWPTPEETLAFKHHHFSGEYNKVEAIGDCTEQVIQKSSNTKAQYQTYSSYKSRNTHKKLIFCTKGGSICYVSKSYSGSSSDRFITEDCNVVQKFTPGFSVMFDKGFVVQDIFLPRKVTVIIPPFVRSKRQFTPSEVYQCKRIATARIYIERVMGRLKEFRLLDHTLPLNLVDLIDYIWIIAAAITNLQPPLVKIK